MQYLHVVFHHVESLATVAFAHIILNVIVVRFECNDPTPGKLENLSLVDC